MKFPTLRYPRLCRALPYVVILGSFFLLIAAVSWVPILPEIVKLLLCIGLTLGLLVVLIREFPALMCVDIILATLSGLRTARTEYPLPKGFDPYRLERRLCRFGAGYAPTPRMPQPKILRYRLSGSQTIYSRGIERVAALYACDRLDAEGYREIFQSAKANSRSLLEKKKPRSLDSSQKKAPLHRVTVVFLLANEVDPQLGEKLFDQVCKGCGEEMTDVTLPCVIDLREGRCTFSSQRLPYVGFGYPAKNRGIRLIRRMVFDDRLPLRGNEKRVPMKDEEDLDQSLWQFWQKTRVESGIVKSQTQKTLKHMKDRELLLRENVLYLKRGDRGLALLAREDPEEKRITLEEPTFWSYPEHRPISKKDIMEIKETVTATFAEKGWQTAFGEDQKQKTRT